MCSMMALTSAASSESPEASSLSGMQVRILPVPSPYIHSDSAQGIRTLSRRGPQSELVIFGWHRIELCAAESVPIP